MKKIKLLIKTFIAKVKKKISDLWYKHVTKPRLIRKELRAKELDIKILHNNFEERFGFSSKLVKDTIVKLDTGYKKLGQTDKDYLNEELIKGRKAINNTCGNNSPLIVDIDGIVAHNEYYANRHDEGKKVSDIIDEENQEAKKTIDKKELI